VFAVQQQLIILLTTLINMRTALISPDHTGQSRHSSRARKAAQQPVHEQEANLLALVENMDGLRLEHRPQHAVHHFSIPPFARRSGM